MYINNLITFGNWSFEIGKWRKAAEVDKGRQRLFVFFN